MSSRIVMVGGYSPAISNAMVKALIEAGHRVVTAEAELTVYPRVEPSAAFSPTVAVHQTHGPARKGRGGKVRKW